MIEAQGEQFQQRLATSFSGFRAEWLGQEIFRLFTRPSYFPQLTTTHPCFLVGGRGTGKTTTLRCLSYQGQAALRGSEQSLTDPASWPFVGMYYRVNTNRVRAFSGCEVDDHSWLRLFGHYLNLELSDLVLQFLQWYAQEYPIADKIERAALARFGTSIHLGDSAELSTTIAALEISRIRFEAMINNVADSELPKLSLQGAPIDQLVTEVKRLPQFRDTAFFFLIDEYENLDGLQQRIVNTLIKHCGDLYSFKVGVREFGDSERSTLNDHEKLRHPADYKRIEITSFLKRRFSDFAERVCQQRMKSVVPSARREQSTYDIRFLLPGLSPEREALLLGVEDVLKEKMAAVQANLSAEQRSWLNGVAKLEIYVLLLRSQAEGVSASSKICEAMENGAKWRRQYHNYKYAYLFAIRQGRPGPRKYYTGWNQYCQLASSNIRFLLELVDQALTLHSENVENVDQLRPITPIIQTKAAQNTGLKNLRELEGLSLRGAKLSRFLLGMGRVFQVMAEDPVGHTAEVNQFHLANDVVVGEHRDFVTSLLKEGIMHLALIWYPASKLQDRTDIRQFDYGIHPIFAPVLGFGFRRKRKIRLDDEDVAGLVQHPSVTIARLLRKQQREPGDSVPEQTRLFAEFYEG